MRKYALQELKKTKERDNYKIRDIKHNSLCKPQEYLTNSNISNKLKSLIFNLRSKCTQFKDNFHGLYRTYECGLCKNHLDTQENAMTCESVINAMNINKKLALKQVQYSYLKGTSEQQLKLAKVYQSILGIREQLFQDLEQQQADRGNIPDLRRTY